MKIGEEQIDGAKPIARRDKQACFSAKWMNAPRLVGGAFEEAERRCANGHQPPTLGPDGIESRRGFATDLAPLFVHFVVPHLLRLHGEKRAGADMERNEMAYDATSSERIKERLIEMKPCRWRRHGAVPGSVDGLIVIGILVVRGPTRRDVGRQRHFPHGGDCFVEHRPMKVEGEDDLSTIGAFHDGRVQCTLQAHAAIATKFNEIARFEPLRWTGESLPAIAIKGLEKRNRNARFAVVARAAPHERGPDHARIIEHQRIAGAQEICKLGYHPVRKGWFAFRFDPKQTRPIAGPARP